jgi:uncharacterized protein (TIGR02145 family)
LVIQNTFKNQYQQFKKEMMNKTAGYLLLTILLSGVLLIDSCRKDPVIPTLTTNDATDITVSSVITGGTILKDGGKAITAYGVCWSTSSNPTIEGSHTTDGKGAASFTSDITGLTPNTLYYVRAYATNSVGTAYGNEISFTSTPVVVPTLTTTSVTSIALTSAVSGGSITNDGGGTITAKGVCWGTTTAPTLEGSFTSDGNGTGSFASNLTGLLPSTTYYVRAYATNSAGTAYGSELTFTTTAIVVPTLTTATISSITLTSAISGGNISTDGGGAVTAKGVCWSTTTGPTIAGLKSADGNGSGSYVSNITGLTPGVTYYVRAYATNSAGTAYGNELQFITSPVAVPTLSTTAATLITLNSAVSGGNITADGGGSVTARGTCWSLSANPTIAGSKTSDGTGTGSFISNLTGLTPGTTYHIRAYATNSAGTAYGNDLTFASSPVAVPTLTTSAVTGITLNSAVSGGNITSNGGGAVTVSGICWSTTTGPTTSSSKTTDGALTGSFSSNMTGLTAATLYYVRAYATNSAGTAYGNEITFTTNQVVPATLTTTAISSITTTTAASGGNITADGGGAITARGVCWALTATPTTSNFTTSNGTGTGSFVSNITGLTPGTTYYVRSYATNSAGTAYGNAVSFTTSILLPTVTTTAVSSITLTTAVSGGNVTDNGGGTISARGVCWSTTTGPTIAGSKTSDGTGLGSFTSNISGLAAGTTYYLRAYATNGAGTSYGSEVSFTTTAPALPTVSTTAISSITLTTASSGGNVTADGGGSILAKGVCWGTSVNPTISNSHTSNGTGTGTFTSALTSLAAGTAYHVRAYATNSGGTAYGSDITFSTALADVDGNTYNTVIIGSQVWMAENLATTKYKNNSGIPNITDAALWIAATTPAYCWYNNDIATKDPYGAMYNWFAVNTGNLCPTGWHVPTDDEFIVLEEYLGLNPANAYDWTWRGTDQGSQLKSTTGWNGGGNGTNTSGFTALPGGYRYGGSGTFNDLGNLLYFWSSTEVDAGTAYYRRLDYNQTGIYRNGVLKQGGKHVRCLKD